MLQHVLRVKEIVNYKRGLLLSIYMGYLCLFSSMLNLLTYLGLGSALHEAIKCLQAQG